MPDKPYDDRWRQTHLGRLLGHAMRRFDARVLQLMAVSAQAPLALSHLAARDKVGAAHIHLTRHLPLAGRVGRHDQAVDGRSGGPVRRLGFGPA